MRPRPPFSTVTQSQQLAQESSHSRSGRPQPALRGAVGRHRADGGGHEDVVDQVEAADAVAHRDRRPEFLQSDSGWGLPTPPTMAGRRRRC